MESRAYLWIFHLHASTPGEACWSEDLHTNPEQITLTLTPLKTVGDTVRERDKQRIDHGIDPQPSLSTASSTQSENRENSGKTKQVFVYGRDRQGAV